MSNRFTTPNNNMPTALDAVMFSSNISFLSTPVSRELILEILEIGQRAPSGVNAQPWEVHVLRAASLAATSETLIRAGAIVARSRAELEACLVDGRSNENLTSLSDEELKEKLGLQLRFFGAPALLVVTIGRSLGQGSRLDCGLFVQTIVLAARARGIATVVQTGWSVFANDLMTSINAGDDKVLICTVALGFSASEEKHSFENHFLDQHVKWVE